MKIKYVSDLHLEGGYDLDITNDEGCDLLVLAGDITTSKHFPVSSEHFFRRCSERFPDVVYVAGNHEFYRGDIEETREELLKFLEKRFKNIHFLDDESIPLKGFNIWGGTLWTDCNKNDPLTKRCLQASMNDYHLIQWKSREHWKLRPSDTVELHQQSVKRLTTFLEHHFEPTIVVTHMGPSRKSVHPKYADDYLMNGGYSSDLEHLMEKYRIPLWFHGHTHDSFDYTINKTRVLTNPRGYMMPGRDGKRYPENESFDPNKIVEV